VKNAHGQLYPDKQEAHQDYYNPRRAPDGLPYYCGGNLNSCQQQQQQSAKYDKIESGPVHLVRELHRNQWRKKQQKPHDPEAIAQSPVRGSWLCFFRICHIPLHGWIISDPCHSIEPEKEKAPG
jgi:hypothetical protein